MALERSRRGLQLRFRPRHDPRSAVESYGGSKFRESRRDNFGTISGLHFGSPGNLCHLDVGAAERRIVYYMRNGGGIPESGPW
jgi:hypothetical protein